MVGVVTIGLASIFDSTAFPHDTVWSRFGAGYGYVPIILPVLGLMWLWQTRGTHSADPVLPIRDNTIVQVSPNPQDRPRVWFGGGKLLPRCPTTRNSRWPPHADGRR